MARLLRPPRESEARLLQIYRWSDAMTAQLTHEEYPQNYATPQAAAPDRTDPYERNLAGLIGFNPVLPGLRRALGPDVEVEQPIIWPGPEVEMHRAGLPQWGDTEQWVRIKLDIAGATHVTNRGHEITDQQAAQLLGISERAFARGYELAATGLRAGWAAMNPPSQPTEVVEARSPEQRLAATQRRDVPTPSPAAADHGRRR